MSIMICTLIWVPATLTLCWFSFFLGRFPVFDNSARPWVVHRSWVPDPAQDT